MPKPDEGNLNKADESNKNGIVIAISVAAALVVAALLAAAAKIRGSKAH
jgi:hypothetical protein